jgi:hypothetical protein
MYYIKTNNGKETKMKIYQVTMTLLLNDDAKTDWIETVIQDNLERDEEIIEGNITEEGQIK